KSFPTADVGAGVDARSNLRAKPDIGRLNTATIITTTPACAIVHATTRRTRRFLAAGRWTCVEDIYDCRNMGIRRRTATTSALVGKASVIITRLVGPIFGKGR